MSDQQDLKWMRQALRLAARGRGYVEPNPMVGAVVVRDGQVVGEGYHRRYGEPHAEVEALKAAGEAARGATLYVTLEPCCHHGKTGPCTAAIREAGIERVHAAMVDPFPEVCGQGLRELEAAGVRTQVGPLTRQAMRLNEPFIKRNVTGLPFVIAKWAMTLDGAIAAATGHSQWISNTQSRRIVHRLRGRVDAIIVGIGTALADDPRLTARDVEVRRVARRVVVDPRLQLPPESALVESAGEIGLTVATCEAAMAQEGEQVRTLQAAGAEIVPLNWLSPTEDDDERPRPSRLNMKQLLSHLADEHEATNVMVEGGAALHGAFFEQGLVDELWAFVAPKLMADGRHLPPLRTGKQVNRVDRAIPLELRRVRRLGDDLLLRYHVTPPAET